MGMVNFLRTDSDDIQSRAREIQGILNPKITPDNESRKDVHNAECALIELRKNPSRTNEQIAKIVKHEYMHA